MVNENNSISTRYLNSYSTLNLYISLVEWYMKNRWWIWGVTGVYLAYRIYLSIAY